MPTSDNRKEKDIVLDLCNLIFEKQYIGFGDFVKDVIDNYNHEYFNAIKKNVNLFKELIYGNCHMVKK